VCVCARVCVCVDGAKSGDARCHVFIIIIIIIIIIVAQFWS